jgi:hypothetical protein
VDVLAVPEQYAHPPCSGDAAGEIRTAGGTRLHDFSGQEFDPRIVDSITTLRRSIDQAIDVPAGASLAHRRKNLSLLRLHGVTSVIILVQTLNRPEDWMNIKLAPVAAVFALASGCALNGSVNAPALPDDSSPVAGATSRGASTSATQQAAAAAPAGRTRAEVYAEALQVAKHHKSTMQEELEYFVPQH